MKHIAVLEKSSDDDEECQVIKPKVKKIKKEKTISTSKMGNKLMKIA